MTVEIEDRRRSISLPPLLREVERPFLVHAFAFALVALIAMGIGFGTAQLALDRGLPLQTVREGPWVAWPRAHAQNADPYTIARFARDGGLLPPSGESIRFVARTDSEGRSLEGNCYYEISGTFPSARRWTLSVYDTEGEFVENPANRYGFHNMEVLRRPDGAVDINVSPTVSPGNWLPAPQSGKGFIVVLRLYDSPLATEGLLTDFTLPQIQRRWCA